MLKYYVSLPIKKRVGILGIILGFIAIFAGDPYHTTTATVNAKELAVSSVRDIDNVNVKELADWIIQGREDYRLVDLRSAEKFREYNIPTSECLPVNRLTDFGIERNEKIILYSESEFKEAQAWFLLKSMEYKSVAVLGGGLAKWESEILFPSIPQNPTPEQIHDFEKIKEVSKFFGGQPQAGHSAAAEKKISMPKIKAPAVIKLKTSKKKHKREGC